MKRFYFSKLIILITLLLGSNVGIYAQTTVFNYTGTEQRYTVPPGVTAINIDAIGGAGGYPYWQCGNAVAYGLGGRVQADVAVTPGSVLYVYVGGAGGSEPCSNCAAQTGGFNGGQAGGSCAGGSGGASDVRFTQGTISGTQVLPYTATNRVVVAGAGGGGADYYGTGGKGGGLIGGVGVVNATYGGTGGNGGTQSGPGAGVGSATSAPYLGTLGVGGQRYNYSGGGGGYWGGNSGVGTAGGAGGGSSYTDPLLCTNVIHTQGYTPASGNGMITITVLCTAPGFISGAGTVCVGATTPLTNPGATVGTWQSSNNAIATINPSTGVVTGVAPGSVTITHFQSNPCGGASATMGLTVYANPAVVLGSSNACTGQPTALTDATSGGSWSSSSSATATVGSATGIVTGVTTGLVTISYTVGSTGCSALKNMTVNAAPAAISGPNTVCASGSTITLTDITPGGIWTSGSIGNATVTGGGLVTGVTAGSVVISYTAPTGCVRTQNVTVNPLPSSISGIPVVCEGSTTPLTNVGGGTWSSSNTSLASVGSSSGIVSGITAGTPTITYTLSTGCATTIAVLVNPLPSAITGVASACTGATTVLSNASSGGSWTSSDNVIATVAGGVVTGASAGTAIITYTLPTGCLITKFVAISALPTIYNVTGGGGYCTGTPGVHIGLNFANSGVNYKLYNGTSYVTMLGGSNAGLDFGLQTAIGTYTVVGIDAITNCQSNMGGSATVSVNTLPGIYTVTGGGNYCPGGAGAHISLSNSEVSSSYQLYVGGVATGGMVSGTGSALDFGLQTAAGVYTVVAINPMTGCSSNMTGSAVISLNATPTAYNLNIGGGYCVGGTGISVTLDGSDPSISYQLFSAGVPSGASMAGTGTALNFGLRSAGTYVAVATNVTTGCMSNMNGATVISTNPLPNVYVVTGGGAYCSGGAGAHVGLNFSSTGVNYQLYRNSITAVGSPVPGTNAGLDFGAQATAGSYSVIAVDAATGCQKNMTGSVNVSISSLPVLFNVTGGGSYCVGGSGIHVGLVGSTPGIQYQLYYNGSIAGAPMTGTGSALDFGLRTATGNYTVVATNAGTSCMSNMTGSASININTLPTVYTLSFAGSTSTYCVGGSGIEMMLDNTESGVKYQLYKGASAVGASINGTGLPITFGYQLAAGTYTVIASNAANSCTKNMAGSVTVVVNPVPPIFTVTGGGSYCDMSTTGVHIGLGGSSVGVEYQLFNTSGGVGAPVSGTGAAIDFGLMLTPDVYTVVATNQISSCQNNMNGTATVSINPLPTQYTTGGSNSYCAGGAGVSLNLSGSDAGISYQLMNGSTASGSAVMGTGTPLSFSPRTAAGSYTIKATNTATSCSVIMTGTESISINPLPPVFTVTGGGTYCSGGAGLSVDLSGSSDYVSYQLYYMGSGGAVMAGTGAGISFGLQAGVGSYNVIATDTLTHCVANMGGAVSINMLPTPAVQTMSGGGNYCIGGTGVHVGMTGSESTIQYQLYRGTTPVGTVVSGTGSGLDFGLQTMAGTYTVVASPGGVCQLSMSGTSAIVINPLPNVYSMTGGGTYCDFGTGVTVGLSNSDASVKYQLYKGATAIGSQVTGTGTAISFGLQTLVGAYTVKATDTVTGCMSTVGSSSAVNINTLVSPHAFNVAGGGNYCVGGTGVAVTLDGSNTNINYQLYHNGAMVGAPKAGTGTILDFGLQTVTGSYTIIGTDAASLCTNKMVDTATVATDAILTPVINIVANPNLNIVKGQRDTLIASATSAGTPTYQWYLNGFIIPGATNNTFSSNKFVNNDTMMCAVTSHGTCGGVTTTKTVIIHVGSNVGVQHVTASNSNLHVMPNPSNGVFTISGDLGSNSDEELAIEVVDMLGHTVYSDKVAVKNGNVDAKVQLNSSIANGMYILSVRSESESKVFHVVVER